MLCLCAAGARQHARTTSDERLHRLRTRRAARAIDTTPAAGRVANAHQRSDISATTQGVLYLILCYYEQRQIRGLSQTARRTLTRAHTAYTNTQARPHATSQDQLKPTGWSERKFHGSAGQRPALGQPPSRALRPMHSHCKRGCGGHVAMRLRPLDCLTAAAALLRCAAARLVVRINPPNAQLPTCKPDWRSTPAARWPHLHTAVSNMSMGGECTGCSTG